MSKSRSGLFPGSNANAKMLRATTYRAIHAMIKNTKGSKSKSMAVGAYDVRTGNHAIRPRTGKGRPYCINCKKMFSDLIK